MKVIARILFVLYVGAMLTLCLIQLRDLGHIVIPIRGIPTDKLFHWLMFIPFPILFYIGFHNGKGKYWKLTLYIVEVLFFAATLAWSIELLQGLVGYRSKDVLDFNADLAGIVTGLIPVILYAIISKKY